MKQHKSFTYILSVLFLILSAFGFKEESITNTSLQHVLNDTLSFLPNTNTGWGAISSYMKQVTPDSVVLEVILTRRGGDNWKSDHLIGTIINSDFIPKKAQKLFYNLLADNNWSVRITANGQCFINQLKGGGIKKSSLSDSAFVLPLKVKYKNN